MDQVDQIQATSVNTDDPVCQDSRYYCTPCQVQLKNSKSYWGHLRGKKHMDKVGSSTYTYNCEKCDYHTNTQFTWNKHLETNGHKLSAEDNRKLKSQIGKQCALKGDLMEGYILDILKTNPEIVSATRIGQTGNRFDIIYQMTGESHSRGLQVKTLGKAFGSEQYGMGFSKPHEGDTLIVGADAEHEHFCLYLFKDHPKTGISVTFTGTALQKKRSNVHLYEDEEQFTQKLFEMVKLSTKITWDELPKYMTENWAKEFGMIERLKPILEKWQLSYQPMMTVNSSTDCLINDCRIQCKASANKKGSKYYFSLKKETGKTTYEPYSSTDFDFLICEINGNGKFYVIPIEVLIEKGYVKSDQADGIVVIYMASDEDYESDWTLDYVNRFDLIAKKSPHIMDPSLILNSTTKSINKPRKRLKLQLKPKVSNTTAVKKPPNCWQLYVKTINSSIAKCGGLTFADFNKVIGQYWRFMPSAEKENWTHIATNSQAMNETLKAQTIESAKTAILKLIENTKSTASSN